MYVCACVNVSECVFTSPLPSMIASPPSPSIHCITIHTTRQNNLGQRERERDTHTSYNVPNFCLGFWTIALSYQIRISHM